MKILLVFLQLFRVLNVRVVLVDVETWNQGDQITVVSDPNVLLGRLLDYDPPTSVVHDSTMLLT